MHKQFTLFGILICFFLNSNSVFAINDTLIPVNAIWKFLDNGTNQGTNWRELSFVDSAWATGSAQLGYGDGDEATVVSYGPGVNNKYITTYFRKSFQVNNASAYDELKVQLLRDDGAVVYLNGTEIVRSNMPAGAIDYTTLASSGINNAGESAYNTFIVPHALLVNGNNVLAVEIHQITKTNDDISFDLRLIASQNCNPPDSLNASGITTGKAMLSWNSVFNATGYSVQYRTTGSSTWKKRNTNSIPYELKNLTSYTEYEWRVKSNCSLDSGEYSLPDTFTTLIVCAVPVNQVAVNVTSSSALLRWNSSGNAINYKVKYKAVGNAGWNSFTTTDTSYLLASLLPQTAYEWTVQSLCINNSSAISPVFGFSTLPVCNTPSGLSVLNATPDSVTLFCNAVPFAVSYEFQFRLSTSLTWITVVSDTNSIRIGALNPGSNYFFHVRSICGPGNSSNNSSDHIFTTPDACGVPSGISVYNSTLTTADVTWSQVQGALSYEVAYRKTTSLNWTYVNTNLNQLTLSGLIPNSDYVLKVRAFCPWSSSYSNDNIFSTSSVCYAISNLQTDSISYTNVKLSWNSGLYAADYTVEYRISGSPGWMDLIVNDTVTYLDSLFPGSIYEWQVRVNCNYGTSSSFFQGPSFTTLMPDCSIPQSLQVSDLTDSSVVLQWNYVHHPYDSAINFEIKYRVAGAQQWLMSNTAYDSLYISGLLPATNYEWNVTANCILGNNSTLINGPGFATATPACNAPQNLAVSNLTINSVSLSWDTVSYASNYTVQYRVIGNPNWSSVSIAFGSINLIGLNPASEYEWQVRTNCIFNNTSGYATGNNFTTLTPPCNDAVNLTVNSITDTSALLKWNSVPYASTYSIEYKTVADTLWLSINTTDTSITITNLTALTTYQWRVKTNCVYGNFSNFISGTDFTTNPPPCGLPSGFATVNLTIGSVDLLWNPVAAAVAYSVRYREVGSGTWIDSTLSSNSISITGLSPATNYEWQVRTTCIWGNNSSYAPGTNFTTLTPPCNDPTGHSVSNVTITSAQLSWNAVTYASTYTVQYRVAGNMTWNSTTTSTTGITLTSLSPASEYEWQVRTNCIFSNTSGYAAGNNFTTLTPPCNDAVNLTVNSITDTSALLKWNSVPYASTYSIEYKTVADTLWLSINTTDTSITITNLTALTTYQWRIKTNCAYGNFSNLVSGNDFTTNPPPCGLPTGFSVSNLTISSADLIWNPVPAAVAYSVRYRQVGSGTWIDSTLSSNSISINGLSPATTYEWQVRATCIWGNNSNYAPGTNFITLTPPCNDPTGHSVSNVTITTVQLSWNAVTYASTYTVQYRVTGNVTWNSTTTSTTGITLTSLSPASEYEWQVRTNCIFSNTSGYAAGNNFTTLTPPCNNPSGLSVSNLFAISATLSWVAVPYSGTYDLEYRITGDTVWAAINTTLNSITVNNLTPVTTYEWRVKANCIYNNFSGIINGPGFTTPVIPPCNDIPQNIVVSSVTASSALISWTSVPTAFQYNLRYRNIGNANWTTTTASVASKTITLLNSSTTYEVQVQTDCGGNVSAFSNPVSFTTTSSSAADSLINAYSTWKYLDNGSNQGTAWTGISFNDSSWLSGNAELGYGDGDENTVVSYGPDANDKYTTTYFRKSFSVTNPSTYISLALNIVRDDGAVVYINGTEVMRSNMPAGTILSSTMASSGISGAGEYQWQTATVASTAVVAGTNVIAVEMHQNDSTSSDLSFNLRLAGTKNTLASLSRGPYLQMVTPNSFRVRWRTSIATTSKVRFGTTMSYGNEVNNAALNTDHDVLISGLLPNTKYFYTIGSSSQDLLGDATTYCKTSLPTGSTSAFRVWSTGDFGNNSTGQQNVRNSMETYTVGKRPDVWIWLGDNAYNSGTETEYTNNVFNIYPNQLRNIPVYPSIGNHDYAQAGYQSASSLGTGFPYFSIFTLPTAGEAGGLASGTEKYYSYNFGNAHFIALDSYGSYNDTLSAMYNWLKNDLMANTQRWTIAYWHHPPYSMGTHNSDTEVELIDMREQIVPLLEQYKVDLVLNGHSHNYERTWLIKGHTGLENTFNNTMKVDTTNGLSPYYLKSNLNNFNGTVYCVCGNSGQGGSVSVKTSWPHAAMRQYSKVHWGSMILDFNNDTLDAKFLTSTATVYDQFKIVKANALKIIDTKKEVDEDELLAYPNPFSNELHLSFYLNESAPVTIEVLDMQGRLIHSGKAGTNKLNTGYNELILDNAILGTGNGLFIVMIKTSHKVLKTIVQRAN